MKNAIIGSTILLLMLAGLEGTTRADDTGPIPGLPWVHEGTVITSHWYAANLYRKPVTMTPDENGDWRGDDGQLYRKDTHQATDAGGFLQTTVLAIDKDQVAVKTTKFMGSMNGEPSRNSPSRGGEPRFLAPADRNTFCENPDLLAKEASDPDKQRWVRQVTWPEDGKMVDAVRIDKLSPAERILIVYDRKTGIGLHLSSVSSTGADTGSILMEYDLVNCRDLQVPWGKEPIPPAVKAMKSIDLAGSIVQEARFGVRPSQVTAEFSLQSAADRWIEISAVTGIMLPRAGAPVSSEPEKRYYAANEFGGLWIGPVAAGQLHQDQVLDDDPVTKMKTFVSAIDDSSVTITQSNRSTTAGYTYDRNSGLLIGSEWFDALTRFHTTMTKKD
jgi:hypothetical protein